MSASQFLPHTFEQCTHWNTISDTNGVHDSRKSARMRSVYSSNPAGHDQLHRHHTAYYDSPLSSKKSILPSFTPFNNSQALGRSFRRIIFACSACALAPTAWSFWRSSYLRSTSNDKSYPISFQSMLRASYRCIAPQVCLYHFAVKR